MAKLKICVIDNGNVMLLQRTLNSLKKQTDPDFFCSILDCREFWAKGRTVHALDAEYVLFLYSGSCLKEIAVEAICAELDANAPGWLYFDEKTYDAEINNEIFGVLEKPDFDAFAFVQDVYTGEGVVFSRGILNAMDLQYEGSNFSAAIAEMTIAAAKQEDPVHLRRCLLTRHNKPELLLDESTLIAAEMKEFLKKRGLELFGVKRGEGVGLQLIPRSAPETALSVILLSDAESIADTYDYSYIGDTVEIIRVDGVMSYREKCILGAQKAGSEMLCFLDTGCNPPSKDNFEKLLYYATMPSVGVISPCVCSQDEVLYAGVFEAAGNPFRFALTKENISCAGRELRAIRKTSLPAWQFWMVKKELFDQTMTLLEDLSTGTQLSRDNFLMEFAFYTELMGMNNLYVGSIQVFCEAEDTDDGVSGFCDMLLGRKRAYFLDNNCPTRWRSWMRQDVLKNVNAYFPKQLTANPENNKKVLVLTHELSLTGAPMVLTHAVRILREQYQIVVVSPVDGVLRELFLRENVPVLVLGDMDRNEAWLRWAEEFDLVLVNTVVPFRQIQQLGKCNVPVMWWLHDAKSGYEDYLQYVLPETLPENVSTFSVSQYADSAVKTYRPKYKTALLHYGLKDEKDLVSETICPVDGAEGKKLFVSVGTMIRRKGQDVLTQAIRLLPDEVRKQCLFLFIGKCIDEDIYQYVVELEQDYPDEVRRIAAVPHDEIFGLYKQAAAVICSSRDDPLPTFMAETMMVSGVCICSENTGMTGIIRNGENGFLYPNDDPKKLAQCIQSVVEQEMGDALREASRKTFEQNFTMDIFKENLMRCVAQCLGHTTGGDSHDRNAGDSIGAGADLPATV